MLAIEGLAKRFTIHHLGGKRIVGIEPISFAMESGTTTGLVGPSGAGKSSILKCIYRSYLPSSGTIRYRSVLLGEVDLADLDEHRVLRLREGEIGYATQFLWVLPRVSSVDVVAERAIATGVPPDAARRRARELLTRLRIPTELFDAYPTTFSGGEKQRVNIARAIISRPRLLLLDEPTASLDADSVEIVVELLNELRAAGTTMLLIVHDPVVMARLADATVTVANRSTTAEGP